MVLNPTSEHIGTMLQIPLYYTGLNIVAQVSEQENTLQIFTTVGASITMPISLPAFGIAWFWLNNYKELCSVSAVIIVYFEILIVHYVIYL